MGNDFGWDDAFLLGGIVGFAEESMREEDEITNNLDNPEDFDTAPQEIPDLQTPKDTIVKLFKNGHPTEYSWMVKKIAEQRLEWAEDKNSRVEGDIKEAEFLESLESTEKD